MEDDWDPVVTNDSILKPVFVSFTGINPISNLDAAIEKAKEKVSEKQDLKKEEEQLLNPYYDEKTEDWIQKKYSNLVN